MANQDKQLNVRIPDDLASWIKQYAKDNCRSITSQLIVIIREQARANLSDAQTTTGR
ncbi:hypothetical protein PKHYL_29090 [Psychrobacter sp. KH172YL61]|uniref:Arc family DNA-binding protein n=1 Tax=Psychrobacter sp. KH172YL61 TaxID=2517899 RepID=UPI0010BA6205|nr:Arc family DNA-binding protein [Psychrobacter sp. KH172YL61]BBI68718.1 hypothetical protein PKHYL_29090 [Psychrobacter sp. KH172YL61]